MSNTVVFIAIAILAAALIVSPAVFSAARRKRVSKTRAQIASRDSRSVARGDSTMQESIVRVVGIAPAADAREAQARVTADETIRSVIARQDGPDEQESAAPQLASVSPGIEGRKQNESDSHPGALEKTGGSDGTSAVLRPYRGIVRVNLVPPVAADRMKLFQESLASIPGVRIVSTGGSASTGPRIVISLDKPLPLLYALSELRLVARALDTGRKGQVTVEITEL